MAIEDEPMKYESIFALMDKSEDKDDNENEEVNFFDVQKNLKNYSQDKLISLANVLIDTYHSLINEKNVLNEEIEGLEQVRDDMVVNIVDLKEQVEVLTRDNALLISQIDKWVTTPSKGKQVASETYFELDSELKKAKMNLSVELGRNRQLQEDLSRVKYKLDKSLHWTCSSDKVVAMRKGNDGRQGIGYKKAKTPFNPHSKYVSVTDNWLCTHCGNVGHYKNSCKARFQSMHRNKAYVDNKPKNSRERGSSQKLFVDSGCSKHMTRMIENFLSLKALKGGSVSFGNGKKRYILGIGKIGKTFSMLLKMRLGHASFTLQNKLVAKDLVHGLPNVKFKDHKVYDACIKGKQVRTSFKPKKGVSTSRPLELLHMDLYGPMRIQSIGGKKYIFVIVDDFSRFTWTLFLRTKDETFSVFVAFVKQTQVKLGHQVVSIRSNHGTEFDKANFNEFCAKNGINQFFFAPRIPQQNGVVERKNRTLEDMARTMLIASDVAKSFWVEAVNTACHVINKCMIRSLLEKTPCELLNGKKPKLTYLKAFGRKCFILNNGKEALGKFDAKGDEEFFLGYSSHSKEYKGFNKRTQIVEESVHMIFDETDESGNKGTQSGGADDGELLIPNEVPGPSITPLEAEDQVVDDVPGLPDADQRSGDHASLYANDGSNAEAPGTSSSEIQVSK
ncbi:uncharacterized protein LOC132643781 [Lycium barbarum]|uniref:uncharacterized protein LOC132643781 n=1 Tax=Lycium barbarum TaxID=112863 RepID=UPI00293F0A1B|nr:uncharacterized protein LOC132643781 [Lycium barbarum]